MVDVWTSNGLHTHRALHARSGIRLPMDDIKYLNLRRSTLEDIALSTVEASDDSNSLIAQMIKLNAILFEVARMNESASKHGLTSYELDSAVERLSGSLQQWYDELPHRLRDTPENLKYWASNNLGHVFVAIYLGYYHYGQLLFYQYLHEESYEKNNPVVRQYANSCKAHAIGLCDILYRALDTPGAEVYYTMIGHVLVIASTVQLHILLFSSVESQIIAARKRLERNFEILTNLQRLWPILDFCFTRFREFHEACLKSKDGSSFRLDRWMLQFLFDFAKPVEAKVAKEDELFFLAALEENSLFL